MKKIKVQWNFLIRFPRQPTDELQRNSLMSFQSFFSVGGKEKRGKVNWIQKENRHVSNMYMTFSEIAVQEFYNRITQDVDFPQWHLLGISKSKILWKNKSFYFSCVFAVFLTFGQFVVQLFGRISNLFLSEIVVAICWIGQ